MNSIPQALHISSAHDPEKDLLSRALDCSYMRNELQNVLADSWGGARIARVQSAELVRRKPSRRSLIKYIVVLQGKSETKYLSLLGKLRIRSFDRRTFQLATELWNSGFGSHATDGVYVPEPVGAVPKLNMWLQCAIEADSLTSALDSAGGLQYCADAGYALGKLHSLGPRTDRRRDLSDELETLTQRLEWTSVEIPRYARRIYRVLDSCYELAEMIPDSDPVGIHRDFYPDQVLSKPRSTWLIDLDLYALGDRSLDLGNFIAHMQELGLRYFGDRQRYAEHEQAFLNAYINSTGCDSCRFAADAYATFSLARHIAISRKFPARRGSTGRLLSLCEQRLGIYRNGLGTKCRRSAVHNLQGDLQ